MYQYELDDEDEPPSKALISTVSAVADEPPMELPPLADCIDPDALDRLFAHGDVTHRRVTFVYAGYRVTVTEDTVRVEEPTDE